MIVNIKEIKTLLEQGKRVKIKTRDGYSPVSQYIEKGILETFMVTLDNGYFIKVSNAHKFFTNAGWVETKYLRVQQHSILCDTNEYSMVTGVQFIGSRPIVDITVDDEEHAYFGNGMLNHNSGKSLVGAHIIANTQKRGGVAVLIDTETAVNTEFFESVGVDMNKLVWAQHDTVEAIFESIVNIVEKVRSSENKDKLVTIVVDSVSGATTKVEQEAGFDKDGWATAKAIIISKAMRKLTNMIAREKIALVFTNQLRMKMNAQPFADPYTTSGGKAIGFAASTRVRLSQTGKIKHSSGVVIGIKTKAVVVKNRLGPPLREAEFDIYFHRGIDDYTSWLNVLKENGIIKQAGAWYSYNDEKFQSKDFPQFLEKNAKRKEELYAKICDAMIMKYENEFDPASVQHEAVEEAEIPSTRILLND